MGRHRHQPRRAERHQPDHIHLRGHFHGHPEHHRVSRPHVVKQPETVTAGPDGNLWFTEETPTGRPHHPGGVVTEYPIPTAGSARSASRRDRTAISGSSRARANRIGRITPRGVVTEFAVPTASSGPSRHRGRAGRQPLVHRVHRQPDRPDHARRHGHRVPAPHGDSSPLGITAGPDGNLWFTEIARQPDRPDHARRHRHRVSRRLPRQRPDRHRGGAGRQSLVHRDRRQQDRPRSRPAARSPSIPSPRAGSGPYGIAAGPDGNLWFTENARQQDRPDHAERHRSPSSPPLTASSDPDGITAGPDGNLWFTEYPGSKIGRITPGGTVTEFPVPTRTAARRHRGGAGRQPLVHRDAAGTVGRITPGGACHRVPIPTANSGPFGVAAGPDGNLWFTEFGGNRIGRITTGRHGHRIPAGITAGSGPAGITAGPDGNLWFTEQTATGSAG